MQKDQATIQGEQKPNADALRIGDTMTRMRLMMGRRVISRIAIARVAPGLDLSQLDILDVVHRLRAEQQTVTVGAIADAMRLDASRGSRLVAELVARGILRRDACQEDGRRSLIQITQAGEALLSELRNVKQDMIESVLEDWSPQERHAFGTLFERFIDRFDQISHIPEQD
ncbi:MarR family transcriptional regulator [Rhizobium sp. FKY42]|uniref:MarR family winged helix-turn-helix transcriptional regulator n=1 Tax=Rhizobium sp. FKY42 TaxID=2562310 RepID=UPI0010C15638|nr:MarR family transcriptional regulator [Rhizobium sp. FKY42]